jgi:hypothetical protein
MHPAFINWHFGTLAALAPSFDAKAMQGIPLLLTCLYVSGQRKCYRMRSKILKNIF